MAEPSFDHERIETRLIERTETVSEGAIEYEYEYRDAEHEYQEVPEPRDGAQSSVFVVLVLRAAVLVLVLERLLMTEPSFDHE